MGCQRISALVGLVRVLLEDSSVRDSRPCLLEGQQLAFRCSLSIDVTEVGVKALSEGRLRDEDVLGSLSGSRVDFSLSRPVIHIVNQVG